MWPCSREVLFDHFQNHYIIDFDTNWITNLFIAHKWEFHSNL